MKLQLKIGDIVESKAGHDTGRIYVVLEVIDEDFVLAADGEYRKLKNKKKKRQKHLRFIKSACLPDKPKITDIKLIIKNYNKEKSDAKV